MLLSLYAVVLYLHDGMMYCRVCVVKLIKHYFSLKVTNWQCGMPAQGRLYTIFTC